MPAFFQTNLSFFVVLSAGVIAVIVSFFLYRRTVPPVGKKLAVFLGVLRGLYTGAVILLLFKPELTLVWRQNVPKHISILVDRSASMGISDGPVKRIDLANTISTGLRRSIGSRADITSMVFDIDTALAEVAVIDSLNKGTDIDHALRLAESVRPAPDAVIMLTDGNYSAGRNPLYREKDKRIPIYTIGIGDTTEQPDIVITDVQAPKIAYQNKEMTVRVGLLATAIDSADIELILRLDQNIVARNRLSIRRANQEYSSSFSITPKKAGRENLAVSAAAVSGERNEQNNLAAVQIMVLKEKLGVALVSSKADNDYKFIKLLLGEREDLTLFPVVSLGRKTGPELPQDSVDVVVWYQIPGPQELPVLQPAAGLNRSPALIIVSERLDSQKTAFLKKYLPVTSLIYLGRDIRTQARPAAAGRSFAPMSVLESRSMNQQFWQAVPPIDYMFGGIRSPGGLTVLLETMTPLQTEAQGAPVLLSGNVAGRRNLLLLGTGFWRWHFLMAENPRFDSTWKEMLYNLIRWLASQRDAKNVQLTVPDRDLQTGETVHLVADVYDGAFEPVDTAIVRFQVSGPEGKFEIPAANISSGKYQGEFVPAVEGRYRLRSTAWLNDQFLGSDSVGLQILPVIQEFIHTGQNVELLTRLARESGGAYFPAGQADSVMGKLDLTPVRSRQTGTYRIWDRLVILLVLIALMSVEWFVRRRRGLA